MIISLKMEGMADNSSVINLLESYNEVNNDKFILKSKNSMSTGRHAADNLQVNDFVDLTNDLKCFICDKVSTSAFYPFARTVTTTTKTHLAQKLGELMGKKFIVIVAEDDYVCKSCFNLLNQLDNLESNLTTVKTIIKEKIEKTYLSSNKISTTSSGH